MNCRHMPHGLAAGLMSVATAKARIWGISGRFIDA
jgi:hypothetical protein